MGEHKSINVSGTGDRASQDGIGRLKATSCQFVHGERDATQDCGQIDFTSCDIARGVLGISEAEAAIITAWPRNKVQAREIKLRILRRASIENPRLDFRRLARRMKLALPNLGTRADDLESSLSRLWQKRNRFQHPTKPQGKETGEKRGPRIDHLAFLKAHIQDGQEPDWSMLAIKRDRELGREHNANTALGLMRLWRNYKRGKLNLTDS